MKIQIVGLGNVGLSLIQLFVEKKTALKSLGLDVQIVSVSDSKGTAIDEEGISPAVILKHKSQGWKEFDKFVKGYTALDAIRKIESELIVELTPSSNSGEPGLSNIRAAFNAEKSVVTANKGPLVVDYRGLKATAQKNGVRFLFEATVGAHVPVFCMVESCFKVDELQGLTGILNATTNFVLDEMQKGQSFECAIDEAVKAGWAETNYSDDVDGIDSARKLVIMAKVLFGKNVSLDDVKIEGIRHVESLVKEANKLNRKVKLVCDISKNNGKLQITVCPRIITSDDPFAYVNEGNMAVKYSFLTSKEIFVSAQFLGPKQTACAVLNDIVKVGSVSAC